MGLEFKKPGVEPAEDDVRTPAQRKKDELMAQLSALQPKADPEADEIQRLQDDVDFAKAQKAAPPAERIGRIWFAPGRQVLFRQSFKRELQAIVKAGDDIPGQPEKSEAQKRAAEQIAGIAMVRACVKSPSVATIDEWEARYPNIWGDITIALNAHNSSFAVERASK